MSDELRKKLHFLEEEFPDTPPAARKADLQEINQIRAQLGLRPVDERLQEIGLNLEAAATQVSQSIAEPLPDHAEAREIYASYLQKQKVLEAHREYAQRVAHATRGSGQTPVRPLATMGSGGGPLLCDVCEKPIVLEGGLFHGVTADVAWGRWPGDWKSWILGGMVVEIETNGTLRIYHGYPDRSAKHCCNIAAKQEEAKRAAFDSSAREGKWPMILAFIEQEFPDLTAAKQNELLDDILEMTYEYDPGMGINRPD